MIACPTNFEWKIKELFNRNKLLSILCFIFHSKYDHRTENCVETSQSDSLWLGCGIVSESDQWIEAISWYTNICLNKLFIRPRYRGEIISLCNVIQVLEYPDGLKSTEIQFKFFSQQCSFNNKSRIFREFGISSYNHE